MSDIEDVGANESPRNTGEQATGAKQKKNFLWVGSLLAAAIVFGVPLCFFVLGAYSKSEKSELSIEAILAEAELRAALAKPKFITEPLAHIPEIRSSCANAATQEQAQRLIDRLVPNDVTYVSFEVLPELACLAEVEIEVNGKSSYVYVLPDGKYALNGPLYDYRTANAVKQALDTFSAEVERNTAEAVSELTQTVKESLSVGKHVGSPQPEATKTNQTAAVAATPQASNAQSLTGGIERTPITQKAGMTLQQSILSEFLNAQYIEDVQTVDVSDPVANIYVVYDSLCPACKITYRDMDEMAAKYNVRFNWIPAYLNDASWVLAANTLQLLEEEGAQAAKDNLHSLFTANKRPSNTDMQTLMSQINPDYFEKAKASTIALVRLGHTAGKAVGTPLVFVEGANTGDVSMVLGALSMDDDLGQILEHVGAI